MATKRIVLIGFSVLVLAASITIALAQNTSNRTVRAYRANCNFGPDDTTAVQIENRPRGNNIAAVHSHVERGAQDGMVANLSLLILLGTVGVLSASSTAHAATVVALGASNTFGKGVSRNQSYPAQLETLLRGRGLNVRVINAGINGDTTGGMLARLDRVVPDGTSVVILQPGGNDRRKRAPDDTLAIQSRLNAMGIKVVMLPNGMLRGLPHQSDGQHLTPEGYHMLAEELVGQVAAALAK